LTSPASFSAAVERLGLRTGVSGGEGVIMEMFVGLLGICTFLKGMICHEMMRM